MMELYQCMDIYPAGNEEVSIEPKLPVGQKKIVLVTRDECTVYANDAK